MYTNVLFVKLDEFLEISNKLHSTRRWHWFIYNIYFWQNNIDLNEIQSSVYIEGS